MSLATEPQANTQSVSVPVKAMRLSAGRVTQLTPGEASKPSPISMTALTGAVIDHWWWGPMILDPSGFKLRQERVPIDWNHYYDDSIGYIDSVHVEGQELHVSGYLVPYPADPEDITSKVLSKAAAGVPYQASVDFSAPLVGDLVIEYIPEGRLTSVSGQQLTGPLTVFREWPLNAVALCTHGYDARTSAQLSAGSAERTVSLSLPKELATMTLKTTGAPPAADPATTVEKEKLSTPDTNPQTPVKDPEKQATPPATQLTVTPEQLAAWQAEFGAERTIGLLTGKFTPDTARKDQLSALQADNTKLTTQITELENRLKAAKVGDKQALSPDPQGAGGKADAPKGDNIDQLTAANEARMKSTPAS